MIAFFVSYLFVLYSSILLNLFILLNSLDDGRKCDDSAKQVFLNRVQPLWDSQVWSYWRFKRPGNLKCGWKWSMIWRSPRETAFFHCAAAEDDFTLLLFPNWTAFLLQNWNVAIDWKANIFAVKNKMMCYFVNVFIADHLPYIFEFVFFFCFDFFWYFDSLVVCLLFVDWLCLNTNNNSFITFIFCAALIKSVVAKKKKAFLQLWRKQAHYGLI